MGAVPSFINLLLETNDPKEAPGQSLIILACLLICTLKLNPAFLQSSVLQSLSSFLVMCFTISSFGFR